MSLGLKNKTMSKIEVLKRKLELSMIAVYFLNYTYDDVKLLSKLYTEVYLFCGGFLVGEGCSKIILVISLSNKQGYLFVKIKP